MKGTKIVFLENQKLGKLTALKPLNKKDHRNRLLWLFRCECGNEVEVAASDVNQKRRLMCYDCTILYRKEWGARLSKTKTKPDKDGPLTKRFGDYMRAAVRRGYKWMLTKEAFKRLLSQPCYYCGAEPSTEISIARVKTPENTLVYNGIDRKQNTDDYTEENCVTCCFVCNRMKMDLDFDVFLQQINKINKKFYETQSSVCS